MAYRQRASLEQSVRAALTAKPPAEHDRAVADLALALAKKLDEDGMDYKLSAELRGALDALQMSPRSRAQAHRGEVKDVAPAVNPLDQLAAARARKRPAPDLDAAAP